MARSSSDGVAIRYLLPVLRITSCLHIMAIRTGNAVKKVTEQEHHGFHTAAYSETDPPGGSTGRARSMICATVLLLHLECGDSSFLCGKRRSSRVACSCVVAVCCWPGAVHNTVHRFSRSHLLVFPHVPRRERKKSANVRNICRCAVVGRRKYYCRVCLRIVTRGNASQRIFLAMLQ